MEILVLGPGCRNCFRTYELAKQAVAETGVAADVREVKELEEIAKYVMITPGVVVDGEVKSAGRVPSLDELKQWIQERAQAE